jgi:hypothetical protein
MTSTEAAYLLFGISGGMLLCLAMAAVDHWAQQRRKQKLYDERVASWREHCCERDARMSEQLMRDVKAQRDRQKPRG